MTRKPYEIRMEGVAADITFIGDINWWNNSSSDFTRRLAELRAAGVTQLNAYINSGGGSLFDALEIYNQLAAFPGVKKARLGAICASSGTIIACAFPDGIEMASNGQYMIHDPSVSVEGGEKELEATLQLWRNIRQSAIDIYVKRTGLAADDLSDMMARTTWLSADQAKAKGFITTISGQPDDLPEDTAAVLNKYGFKNVPTVLNQAVQPPNPSNFSTTQQMNKAELIVRMGLPADSTDEQVMAAITSNKVRVTQLEADLEKERNKGKQAAAEMLVDTAIGAKKIGAGERDQWVADAVQNFDMVRRVLEKMPTAVQATTTITTDGGNTADTTDRSKWGWDEYAKNDGAALVTMREKEPTKYKALFQARFPGRACDI